MLRLLERALAADPSQKRRIGEVSALGLEHPAADIQAAALELIRKLGVDDMEMEELIGSRLGLASAPVRERARQQMGKEGSVAVERYTPNWQRPDPIEREAPIRPIEDVEELVLTLTRVMNQAGPPDDVERVLDGVSRLCAERPPRFDDLTSALRTQVSKMFESDFMPHFGGVFSVQTAMAQLAAAWLLGKLVVKLGDNSQLLHAAMGARVYWVAFRARSGKVRALLSAPTHEGGWIDPRTLVDRMKTDRCAADDRECEADLIQALFRLTPGHRDEASEAAAMLPGESGKVVRYALGASAEPRDTELWAAARESREPRSSAYELRFHSDKHNPEQLRATMAVHPEPVRGYLRLADVFPGETQAINRTVPGLWAYADPLLRLGSAMPDLIAWASQMCPGNRDGWCAHGAFRLANNLDWYSANWGNRIFLSAFEDSYCEMTRPACLLLALGLMAREATEFDSSRDGFIRVIGDGRLDCERFGAELAGLFAQGVCKGTRLNRAMTETARVSSRHADAVRRILEHALAKGMPQRPADQSALLEAFLEACTAAGAGPESGDLRRLLEGMSGSGKGPKLARAIMALL